MDKPPSPVTSTATGGKSKVEALRIESGTTDVEEPPSRPTSVAGNNSKAEASRIKSGTTNVEEPPSRATTSVVGDKSKVDASRIESGTTDVKDSPPSPTTTAAVGGKSISEASRIKSGTTDVEDSPLSPTTTTAAAGGKSITGSSRKKSGMTDVEDEEMPLSSITEDLNAIDKAEKEEEEEKKRYKSGPMITHHSGSFSRPRAATDTDATTTNLTREELQNLPVLSSGETSETELQNEICSLHVYKRKVITCTNAPKQGIFRKEETMEKYHLYDETPGSERVSSAGPSRKTSVTSEEDSAFEQGAVLAMTSHGPSGRKSGADSNGAMGGDAAAAAGLGDGGRTRNKSGSECKHSKFEPKEKNLLLTYEARDSRDFLNDHLLEGTVKQERRFDFNVANLTQREMHCIFHLLRGRYNRGGNNGAGAPMQAFVRVVGEYFVDSAGEGEPVVGGNVDKKKSSATEKPGDDTHTTDTGQTTTTTKTTTTTTSESDKTTQRVGTSVSTEVEKKGATTVASGSKTTAADDTTTATATGTATTTGGTSEGTLEMVAEEQEKMAERIEYRKEVHEEKQRPRPKKKKEDGKEEEEDDEDEKSPKKKRWLVKRHFRVIPNISLPEILDMKTIARNYGHAQTTHAAGSHPGAGTTAQATRRQ